MVSAHGTVRAVAMAATERWQTLVVAAGIFTILFGLRIALIVEALR